MSAREINWGGYPPQFLEGLSELTRLRSTPPGLERWLLTEILQILERYEDGGEVLTTEEQRVFNTTAFTLKEISQALTHYKVVYLSGVDY